jgi:hypothetical protein
VPLPVGGGPLFFFDITVCFAKEPGGSFDRGRDYPWWTDVFRCNRAKIISVVKACASVEHILALQEQIKPLRSHFLGELEKSAD